MLLAIDVGNTQIVIGLFDSNRLLGHWRFSTRPILTADEYRMKFQSLFSMDGHEYAKIDNVIISSVVPRLTRELPTVFSSKKIYIADHTSPFSFPISLENPEQVGADRLVNAEAVFDEIDSSAIIVDSGTATTICALSRERGYLGGAIIPGIEISFEALTARAAKLSSVQLIAPKSVIGTTTEEALQSGMIFGYAEMIDGLVRRFKKEMNELKIKVIATGGVGELLKDEAKEIEQFDPHLTLKGLRKLSESTFN